MIGIGEVICVYRVLAESQDGFASVKKSLEKLRPNRLEEEPIAFGLKALKFTIIIPDGPGKVEELENKLNSIKGVGSVENLITSRAM